mmetsp:Transcript_6859/g.10567  ORF Transcript_6859/g.10567 Transcript_6859/m.10567 type:complete len:284 (+) Transcript_6859:278-1129(+)
MGTAASTDKDGANSSSSPRNSIDNDFEQVDVRPGDGDEEPTAATTTTAAATTTVLEEEEEPKSEELVMNDMSKSTVLIEKPRRIVKATHPEGGATAAATTPSPEQQQKQHQQQQPKDDNDNDTDHHHHHDNAGASIGISTDEELLQDSIEQHRTERMRQLARKQKTDRQHVTEERRKQTAPIPRAQANPFSRFLSAFSVEPEFPNHKRKEYEDNNEEDDDLDLPPKKKRHNDDEDDDDDEHGGSGSKKSYFDLVASTEWKWIATATAVAAVAVMVAMKYRKGR